MKISMIAGMATNRVIGNKNQLPWHYSEDLKHFKTVTTGHTIVMGYNTYLSLGRPLPNRRNVVLSNTPIEGIETYPSIPELLETLKNEGLEEIFIIGGANVYRQFLPLADRIYLTQIKHEYQGDTFFPEFENDFQEVQREIIQDMDFVIYERK